MRVDSSFPKVMVQMWAGLNLHPAPPRIIIAFPKPKSWLAARNHTPPVQAFFCMAGAMVVVSRSLSSKFRDNLRPSPTKIHHQLCMLDAFLDAVVTISLRLCLCLCIRFCDLIFRFVVVSDSRVRALVWVLSLCLWGLGDGMKGRSCGLYPLWTRQRMWGASPYLVIWSLYRLFGGSEKSQNKCKWFNILFKSYCDDVYLCQID